MMFNVSKVWIDKNETLSKIENSAKSTILIRSSWFSSNIKYIWDGYFDGDSYELTKNYGCYTIFSIWYCLIFYDSDFTSLEKSKPLKNILLVQYTGTFLILVFSLKVNPLSWCLFTRATTFILVNWHLGPKELLYESKNMFVEKIYSLYKCIKNQGRKEFLKSYFCIVC